MSEVRSVTYGQCPRCGGSLVIGHKCLEDVIERAADSRDPFDSRVAKVARVLQAAGWRDTCDAQWEGLQAALPALEKALTS